MNEEEEGQLELLQAMHEISEERARREGIPFDQVEMSDQEILEKMKERRMR